MLTSRSRPSRSRPRRFASSSRLDELLDKLKGDVAAEELRGVRAVDVLEQIGTDPARDILKDLAAGAPAALTTQAAKAALDRLEQTPKP